MTKSSIHILSVKSNSERHNKREQILDYVRQDLTKFNESFIVDSIENRTKFVRENYELKTRQKIQDKATPIREGVLIIEESTTIEDLKKLAKILEDKFKIKTIQAFTHKDEGHYELGVWKSNFHAHMVFDWTDHQTGKSLRLDKKDMSEIQTLVAETLGLERGQSSDVKHLKSISFKIEAEKKKLEKMYGLDIESLKIEAKKIKNTADLERLNYDYMKEKKIKELSDIQVDINNLRKNYNKLVTEFNQLNQEVQQKKNQKIKIN